MNEILDAIIPWIVIVTYTGFAYVAYKWYVSRPKEKQPVSKSAAIGILTAGFILSFIVLFIYFRDPQSQTWALFGL